jgi:ABC-type transporter Mla MlaB component
VVEQPTGFRLHDHVLWPHAGADDWRSVVVPFLQEGLTVNQRLVYAGTLQAEELLADLAGLPDLDSLLASRRLALWSAQAEPGGLARSVASEQVARLDALVSAARADGYAGVRLASEVTGAVSDPDDAAAHLRLECLVDGVAAARELVVMCGIDRLVVRPVTMQAELAVHPVRAAAGEMPWLHAVGVDTWSLVGQVDMVSRAGFAQAVTALPEVMCGDVLHLHVDRLDFIDVAGMRALVGLAEAVSDHGRVVLHHAPDWFVRALVLSFGSVDGLELVRQERRRLRTLR